VTKSRIVIMAGGTGGHIFPALAVARALQAKNWEVHWLGTKKGMEADIIPKAGIPLRYISVKGVRRNGFWTLISAPFQITWAILQSLFYLICIRPHLVLGMGGFAAGPGGVAAWLLRRPLLIHEQNSVAGLTNRWLSKIAAKTLEAFPNTFSAKTGAVYTGNPVRAELLTQLKPSERFKDREGPIRLLVLGGSRGARALNELCPAAIALMPPDKRPMIWHQAGQALIKKTTAIYDSLAIPVHLEPFVEDMANAYAWADLVLCRAGALTVAELAAVGVGSILVPHPFVVDDHQTTNGQFLSDRNAAKVVQQSILTAETLAGILTTFCEDRARLCQMAEAAYALSKRDALHRVVLYCEETSCYAR
jgi:UDP-N-acetylglucosamine--N-acetylmuramyl-(pentapeptide) pyrophosphoryl-undecaprenol N-acetylglucosamine transferase